MSLLENAGGGVVNNETHSWYFHVLQLHSTVFLYTASLILCDCCTPTLSTQLLESDPPDLFSNIHSQFCQFPLQEQKMYHIPSSLSCKCACVCVCVCVCVYIMSMLCVVSVRVYVCVCLCMCVCVCCVCVCVCVYVCDVYRSQTREYDHLMPVLYTRWISQEDYTGATITDPVKGASIIDPVKGDGVIRGLIWSIITDSVKR